MLSNRGRLPNNAAPRPNDLAAGASRREIPAGATARLAESSRALRPGNRATMATPAWERNALNHPAVEECRPHECPLHLAAAEGDRR
jgi:transcription elongation factor